MEHRVQGCETDFPVTPYRRATFFQGPFLVTGDGAAAHANCWSCACSPSSQAPWNNGGPECWFTADQEMDVTVTYHIWLHRSGNGGAAEPSRCRINSTATNNPQGVGGVTTGGTDTIDDYGGCSAGADSD